MKDICQVRSKKVVTKFLNVTAMNYDARDSFLSFAKKMELVKNRMIQRVENFKFRERELEKVWDKEMDIMIMYCAKHKGKNKKMKTLLKKLQSFDHNIKTKLIKFYSLKSRLEHTAHVQEWLKAKKMKLIAKSEDENEKQTNLSLIEGYNNNISYLTTLIEYMNKYLYKGVDNAILDIEYKKENKGAAKAPVSKPKFNYEPLPYEFLNWKYAPPLIFNPSKKDIQMMIKKATTIKDIDEIELNPSDIYKKTI